VPDSVAATVDLVPTLADLLRLGRPHLPFGGRSLLAALSGARMSDVPVYLETEFPLSEYGWSPMAGVIDGDWKYVRAPRQELYHLTRDPGETSNLAEHEAAKSAELQTVLAQIEASMRRGTGSEVKMDPAARQALMSLGYVGGGGSSAHADNGAALRDPKDAVWMRTEFMDAGEDMRQGRLQQAEKRLLKLIEQSPESLAFHYKLGTLLFGQARFEEARAVFEGMSEQFPDNYAPFYNLGKTLMRLQHHDEAIAALERARNLDPDRVDIHNNLGLAHLYKGDTDSAIAAFRRSIALDDDQVDPHSNLGHVFLQLGRVEEAMAEFRRALEADATAVGPRYNLGLALLQAARYREAVAEFEQVVRANPGFADAVNKLNMARELERSRGDSNTPPSKP
jgi:tetratricopeptide (TPR) repeat protein